MPPPGIVSFFTLVGLDQVRLALSALLVYLPFATYTRVPLHGVLGNLFSELSPLSVFVAALPGEGPDRRSAKQGAEAS